MDNITVYLRSCEEALLDPAVRRDPVQVDALLDGDFLEFGSSGRVWTREQIVELLATEIYTPPSVEDFQCALLSESVALVTYRAVRIDISSDLISAALRSSIWTDVSGRWRMRFHQGTRQL
jgi:hypothetical protein